MRIGNLASWQVLEDGESIKFPEARPGGIVFEVMAIAADITISDGLIAYPIGTINGYERLEFRTDSPVELFVKNGSASYKTSELVEIGQYRTDGEEDFAFVHPFVERSDGVDPAVKMMIARSNARARDREAMLMGEIERLVRDGEKRNGAAERAPAAVDGAKGADPAPSTDAGGGKSGADAGGDAGTEGPSKPEGKPQGDAGQSKGKQPPA